MRLLYVATPSLPNLRAHSVQIIKMCAAFSRAGAELTLLARPQGVKSGTIVGPKKWPVKLTGFYGVPPCFHLARPRRSISRSLLLLWLPKDKQKLWSVGFTLSALVWIIGRRKQYDVIYTRLPLLALYTARLGIPTVFEAHVPLPNEQNGASQRILRNFVQIHAHAKFLGIVAISDTLRQLYIDCGIDPKKIIVSHDAVDLDLFEPPLDRHEARRIISNNVQSSQTHAIVDGRQSAQGEDISLPPDSKIVGYCGHFYEGRGIPELIECASRHPDWVFLLIGGLEEDVATYRALVESRKLQNVRFAGFVPQANLAPYMFACDILTMPYMAARETSPFMSPMKMFEYLAAGRGIVTTDWPQIREVLQHEHNALVCGRDVDSLDSALSRLMQDDHLRLRLQQQARRDAQQYTWSQRAQSILHWIAKQRSETSIN